jgi:hypothetical protein
MPAPVIRYLAGLAAAERRRTLIGPVDCRHVVGPGQDQLLPRVAVARRGRLGVGRRAAGGGSAASSCTQRCNQQHESATSPL